MCLTNQDAILAKTFVVFVTLKKMHGEVMGALRSTHGIAATSYIRLHSDDEEAQKFKEHHKLRFLNAYKVLNQKERQEKRPTKEEKSRLLRAEGRVATDGHLR